MPRSFARIAQPVFTFMLASIVVTGGWIASASASPGDTLYNVKLAGEKVEEILDSQTEEIEYLNADRRQLFWMTKKRLANDFGVILNNEDRFSDIAHKILDYLWEEDYIHFTCSDNQIKNVIFGSLDDFIKGFEKADGEVLAKLKNYKRKLIPGTEDYDLVYHRLYEEELIKRGLI